MFKIKKKKILIVVSSIIAILAIITLSGYLYINSKVSKIKHVDLPSDDKIGIHNNDTQPIVSDVDEYENILLLGIDTRDYKTDPGRSDCTMIITIDKKHKKVKVTSLLRDMVMNMEGNGPMAGKSQDRLNHAYAYGGPTLALKTVNENFNLSIRDFIKVDFSGVEKIIDAVGGVPINISASEIKYANSYIDEVAEIEHKSPDHIKKPGLQNLTGAQALGYSRIRYVGGDIERTERQRTVLDELFKKLSSQSILKLPGLSDQILPYMETNLTTNELMSLGTYIITNNVKSFDQSRLPLDNTWSWNNSINNVYFAVWDRDKNIDALHKFIFEEDAGK